jgi:hypothetical protein
VPEASIRILPEMVSKIGLLRSEPIRKVLGGYIMGEQYLERLILADGQLQANMPEGRQLVFMSAKRKSFVIKFNRTRANVVKEAIDALAHYLK